MRTSSKKARCSLITRIAIIELPYFFFTLLPNLKNFFVCRCGFFFFFVSCCRVDDGGRLRLDWIDSMIGGMTIHRWRPLGVSKGISYSVHSEHNIRHQSSPFAFHVRNGLN